MRAVAVPLILLLAAACAPRADGEIPMSTSETTRSVPVETSAASAPTEAVAVATDAPARDLRTATFALG